MKTAGLDKSPINKLFDWAERFDQSTRVPAYLYDKAAYQHESQATHDDCVHCYHETDKQSIIESLEHHAKNREVAKDIAAYLDNNNYPELADKIENCRNDASVFERSTIEGKTKLEYIWDYKCGQKKLCPHCAREAQQYFVDRYIEPINEWSNRSRNHQLQYAVITWPNIKPGELKEKKTEMFKQIGAWLKRDVCESVHGALVSMEDPLSNHGDFNVHVNLLLLVNGRFSWQAARHDWHKHTKIFFPDCDSDFQIYFKDVSNQDIKKTVMELVKYMAKHITNKDAAGGAPGLVDWPIDLFTEWWDTQQNSRRVRSYGVLYRLHAFYWQFIWNNYRRLDALARLTSDPDYTGDAPAEAAGLAFHKLPKALREALKPLLIPKAIREFTEQEGHFIGRVSYNYSLKNYAVRMAASIDLIQGHNSTLIGKKNIERNKGPPIHNH